MEFDDSCPWPRRLLHIQTLTSYQWQPGNVYGGWQNPKYSALSYTWGRWEISEADELPEVKAIPIKGVSWQIPRVDPVHFTVEAFEAAISDTADPHPSQPDRSRVEFLWLDVACIDQAPDSREKALEIGRQAKIFRGASQVFVWLTTHDRAYYTQWAHELEPFFELMCGPKFHTDVDLRDWAMEVTMIIADFLADPWFSSLWTLQEIFLSPEAVIIPSDALKDSMDLCPLHGLSGTLHAIKDALDYNDELRNVDKYCGLSAVIDETGLLVCLDKNLMGLLTAAGNRTTRREEDRVYGIMQVFEFRLGNSAPDAEHRSFSLEELNDQLGEALLERDPVMSQMYVYQRRVKLGKGWRLNRDSAVPTESKHIYHHKRTQPELQHCAALFCQTFSGSLWGRFRGPTASFRAFARFLVRDWPNAWSYGSAMVLLDREMLDECPASKRTTSLSRAAFLASCTPEITILLLGTQLEREEMSVRDRTLSVGLLLRRRPLAIVLKHGIELGTWQRIGLFLWDTSSERSEEEAIRSAEPYKLLANSLSNTTTVVKDLHYLKGAGQLWNNASGLFG